MVPHGMSTHRPRARQNGCPSNGFRRSTLSSIGCTTEEFVVFTLPRPSRPGHEFVVCTPLTPGHPNVESVRHHAHRKVASAMCAFAARFPESAKLTSPPGFPDDEAGSIHGPRRHEARSTSRLPARSPEPHCTGRPYFEADLVTPVSQSNKTDLIGMAARAMKSSPSLRLPDAPASTSLHGVPRCLFAPHPGFPSHEATQRRGAPEQQSHDEIGRAHV